MGRRGLALGLVTALLAAAAVLLALGEEGGEVGLGSLVELWADLTRDVDRAGLVLTRVSAEREMEIGREIADEVARRWRVLDGTEPQAYVATVGSTLAPHVERPEIGYRFHVLDAPMVNAFALPGGQIYVTTGMLGFLESEAELAAILGHEVGHVDLRHAIERLQYELAVEKVAGDELGAIARIGYGLVGLGFSEQQELEADRDGALLAARAGYDPRAGVSVFARLSDLEGAAAAERPDLMVEELGIAVYEALEDYFATHPPSGLRVRRLRRVLDRNGPAWRGREFYIGRSNYADRVPRSVEDRAGERRTFDR